MFAYDVLLVLWLLRRSKKKGRAEKGYFNINIQFRQTAVLVQPQIITLNVMSR
jgi:hypothetical protein